MHSSCAGEYISTPPPPACLPAHSTICSAGQHFYASQGPRLRIKWTGRVRLHFTAYVHAMLFKKRPLGFALQRNKELCTSNWHIAFRSHLCLGLRDTLAVDIFFGAQTSSERAEIISSSPPSSAFLVFEHHYLWIIRNPHDGAKAPRSTIYLLFRDY